jgi:uncharacterized protein (DUF488 family)
MPAILTIGYTKKSLEQFIRLLADADVDAIIDVRLRNTSQLAGFSKRDDLAFLLREGFGIEYEHRRELAPTPALLDAFKADEDWDEYERLFVESLAEKDAEQIGLELLARYRRPCLLCAESSAEQCHRRLIADWWQEHLPDMEIVHL